MLKVLAQLLLHHTGARRTLLAITLATLLLLLLSGRVGPPALPRTRPVEAELPPVGSERWVDGGLVDPRPSDCTFVDPVADLRASASRLLSKHGETEDGLLHLSDWKVGDERVHPILDLLAEGTDRFERTLKSQSRTLEEAVRTYVERNGGRAPPAGFDRWWTFAKENDVLFPDEGPSPSLLQPFYDTPHSIRMELLKRSESLDDARGDLVRLINEPAKGGLRWEPVPGKTRTRPGVTKLTRSRVKAQLALVAPIAHLLPAFNVVYNTGDQPISIRDSSVLAHGAIDWHSLCKIETSLDTDRNISFVRSLEHSSDPCRNPSLLDEHGFFLQSQPVIHNARLKKHLLSDTQSYPVPILSQCSTYHHADLLVPSVGIEGFISLPPRDYGWMEKVASFYWRGSLTGLMNYRLPSRKPSLWRTAQRARLHRLANEPAAAGQVELSPTEAKQAVLKAADGKTRKQWSVSLASSYFWQLFSWWPELGQQCSWWDGTCSEIQRTLVYVLKDQSDVGDRHKINLDIDGNGWSARFGRLLAGKSLVVKSTIFHEWSTATFFPWHSYVPLTVNYRELDTISSFFLSEEYDQVAEKIASNGHCLRFKTQRIRDMQSYTLRLYLELSRLYSPTDGPHLDFYLDQQDPDEE